jgi:hypothetical protein
MVSGLALLLSLVVPRGVTMVLTGLVLMFGSKAVGLLGALVDGGAARSAVDWLGGYVPNFAKLNLITRYTDGIAPLAGPEFLGLFVYGAVVIALCVSLGAVLFERRPL